MQFKLGGRVIRVTKWIFRRVRIRRRYHRLGGSNSNPMAKLLTWARMLKRGARLLCERKGSGYIPIGSDPDSVPAVPKGHLAVYVEEEDGACQRVVVPVIYFNHPLFSDLLKEAEKEFGFEQQGAFTIPCRFTEFERVKTRIASGSGLRRNRRRLAWRVQC
ncbi:auxin-responsive protein SAUR36-like [Abrus precatorius]|uniref:Auxin-responsive protein SAUR36-like n=1 Tax=Abrus precatorius TaxID=3816 RepID=A0A8B8JSJ7_ABRPR|nr:auxin-responsive protein SAUR36-like [Abrus precatorius]